MSEAKTIGNRLELVTVWIQDAAANRGIHIRRGDRTRFSSALNLTASLDRLLEVGHQILGLFQTDGDTRVACGNAAVRFLATQAHTCDRVTQAGRIEYQLDVPAQVPVNGSLFPLDAQHTAKPL